MMKKMTLLLLVTLLAAAAPLVHAGPAVRFVGADAAVGAVLPAAPGPCVSRLPAWELSLGEGTYNRFAAKKSAIDCRDAFIAAVRDFTDEEKELLTQYVGLVDSVINAEFKALNSLPWSFVVISDSTDFGVPNTRKYIILTKGLLREMQEWMEKQSSMLFVGMEILIYEKARLLQDARPEPFERFYREAWGFRKISALSMDRLMQDNGLFFTRVPPNEWVVKMSPKDKEYILPALLLRDAGKGGGGTVQRVAVTIDSTSKGFFPRKSKRLPIDYKDLRFIPQYRKKFSLSEYDYHPAELSADLLAKFLVMKYVSSRYGTAPAKTADYSQIDVLMKMVGEARR
jgi:hypothetical protein